MQTLFIHGFGGGPEHWEALRSELPSGLRGQAITLSGHGSRAHEDGPFSIEAEAQGIADLLGDTETVLIGHSMGTRIALEIAHVAAKSVKALILIEGSCVPASPTLTAQYIAAQGKAAVVAELLDSALTARLDRAQIAALTASMMQMSDDAMSDYTGSMAAWDTNKAMERINAVLLPVLVLQSTRFTSGTVPTREEIETNVGSVWFDAWAKNPNAIGRTILEAGHYLPQERPTDVSIAVEDFLSGI